MNRYKFTEPVLKKAIAFLKKKKGKPAVWVVKYKDDLVVRGTKLFYKERQIIPLEKINDVLRDELYKKDGDTPSGRDSAFHILKQRYVGISRRTVMDFIRRQKPLGEVKAALNRPKQSGGEKMKNYVFETDLVFLKKTDLENANKRFIRKEIPDLSYFLSTVEKVTGLCRFDYIFTKKPAIVTPLVIKQCKEMVKLLKTTLKKCDLRCDKGKEFDIKTLGTEFKEALNVSKGHHVENKNSQFQTNFFKIIRQRKAHTIDDAMQQAEKLLNNTYNRIHKKTANELVERSDEKEDLKEYNTTRKTFIAGDKRKPFEVGQHVRLLIKEKITGIAYKKYKNQTYSEAVYLIKKITKKSVPRKYYVKGKWWLQSDLLKSAPRDKKSIALVKERDVEFKQKHDKERKEHEKNRLAQIKEEERLKKIDENKRPSRLAGLKSKIHMVWKKTDEDKLEDKLDKLEEEEDVQSESEKLELEEYKKQLIKKKKKPKGPKKTVQYKMLFKYLQKKNLPTGGSEKDLKRRVLLFKKAQKKITKTV